MGKALFADVAFPANRMPVLHGFLNMKHQLVERKIEKLVVHHIIGYFKGEVLAVRVMGKTGERYVLLGIAYAVGKLQWGVFGTEHVYLLGRHVADFLIEEVVEFIFQFLDARLLGNGSIAEFLHLSAENLIVHILWIFIAVVWLCAILIYIMYEHRSHAPHADGFLALCEIIFQGFLLKHHSCNVSHG